MKKLFKFVNNRLSEPSTYAGLSALAFGLENLNVINEAQLISDTSLHIATDIQQGNYLGAILAAVFAAVAIIKSDKKEN
jgi:hypothetical protein